MQPHSVGACVWLHRFRSGGRTKAVCDLFAKELNCLIVAPDFYGGEGVDDHGGLADLLTNPAVRMPVVALWCACVCHSPLYVR